MQRIICSTRFEKWRKHYSNNHHEETTFRICKAGKIWAEHRRMLKYFVEVGTLVKKKQIDVIALSEAELTPSTVFNSAQHYVTI